MRLFREPVAWRANKQGTATTSLTEVEFPALSQTAKEAICLLGPLFGFTFQLDEPPTIQCGCLQAIRLLNRKVLPNSRRILGTHSRGFSKRSNEIRWLQRQETERLILDGLTRLFSKLRFRRLMEMVWATSPDKATYVNTSPRETRGRTREKWGGRKGRKRRKKEKEEVIIFTHSRRLGYNPWRRGRQTATHELNAYRGLRD